MINTECVLISLLFFSPLCFLFVSISYMTLLRGWLMNRWLCFCLITVWTGLCILTPEELNTAFKTQGQCVSMAIMAWCCVSALVGWSLPLESCHPPCKHTPSTAGKQFRKLLEYINSNVMQRQDNGLSFNHRPQWSFDWIYPLWCRLLSESSGCMLTFLDCSLVVLF